MSKVGKKLRLEDGQKYAIQKELQGKGVRKKDVKEEYQAIFDAIQTFANTKIDDHNKKAEKKGKKDSIWQQKDNDNETLSSTELNIFTDALIKKARHLLFKRTNLSDREYQRLLKEMGVEEAANAFKKEDVLDFIHTLIGKDDQEGIAKTDKEIENEKKAETSHIQAKETTGTAIGSQTVTTTESQSVTTTETQPVTTTGSESQSVTTTETQPVTTTGSQTVTTTESQSVTTTESQPVTTTESQPVTTTTVTQKKTSTAPARQAKATDWQGKKGEDWDYVNNIYAKGWTAKQIAADIFKNEGIKPTQKQLDERAAAIQKAYGKHFDKDGKMTKPVALNYRVSKPAVQKFKNDVADARGMYNAKNQVKKFFKISQDHNGYGMFTSGGKTTYDHWTEFLDKNINKNNISEFLTQYVSMVQRGEAGSDKGIADTVMSEKGDSASKRAILNKLFVNLKNAAVASKVSSQDINNWVHKFNSAVKNMDKDAIQAAFDGLNGLVIKVKNVQKMSKQEAAKSVSGSFKQTVNDSTLDFEAAMKETGKLTKLVDSIGGLNGHGWKTRGQMREILSKYGADATDLINKADAAKSGNPNAMKEFEDAYRKLFGVEFNPDTIAKRDAVAARIGTIHTAEAVLDKANQFLSAYGKNPANFEQFKRGVGGESMGKSFDDSVGTEVDVTLNYLVTKQASVLGLNANDLDEKTYMDVLKLVVNAQKNAKQQAKGTGNINRLYAQLEQLNQACYGTKAVGKEVAKFNENMATTNLVTEMAVDIGSTVALSFVPGLGEAAIARWTLKLAKNGKKATKLYKTLTGAQKTFGTLNNMSKGRVLSAEGKVITSSGKEAIAASARSGKEIIQSSKAIKAGKEAEYLTKTGKQAVKATSKEKWMSAGNTVIKSAYHAGNASAAVALGEHYAMGYDWDKATEKCGMMAFFGGAGALGAEVVPAICASFGVESKVAIEVLEEIANGTTGYSWARIAENQEPEQALVSAVEFILMSQGMKRIPQAGSKLAEKFKSIRNKNLKVEVEAPKTSDVQPNRGQGVVKVDKLLEDVHFKEVENNVPNAAVKFLKGAEQRGAVKDVSSTVDANGNGTISYTKNGVKYEINYNNNRIAEVKTTNNGKSTTTKYEDGKPVAPKNAGEPQPANSPANPADLKPIENNQTLFDKPEFNNGQKHYSRMTDEELMAEFKRLNPKDKKAVDYTRQEHEQIDAIARHFKAKGLKVNVDGAVSYAKPPKGSPLRALAKLNAEQLAEKLKAAESNPNRTPANTRYINACKYYLDRLGKVVKDGKLADKPTKNGVSAKSWKTKYNMMDPDQLTAEYEHLIKGGNAESKRVDLVLEALDRQGYKLVQKADGTFEAVPKKGTKTEAPKTTETEKPTAADEKTGRKVDDAPAAEAGREPLRQNDGSQPLSPEGNGYTVMNEGGVKTTTVYRNGKEVAIKEEVNGETKFFKFNDAGQRVELTGNTAEANYNMHIQHANRDFMIDTAISENDPQALIEAYNNIPGSRASKPQIDRIKQALTDMGYEYKNGSWEQPFTAWDNLINSINDRDFNAVSKYVKSCSSQEQLNRIEEYLVNLRNAKGINNNVIDSVINDIKAQRRLLPNPTAQPVRINNKPAIEPEVETNPVEEAPTVVHTDRPMLETQVQNGNAAGIRYYVNTCSDEALMANAEYLESALKNMTNVNKSTVESALKELSARKAQIQAKPVKTPVEAPVQETPTVFHADRPMLETHVQNGNVAGIRYYVNACSDEALLANAEYLESALKNMTNANKSTVESALKELSTRKAQIQARAGEALVEVPIEEASTAVHTDRPMLETQVQNGNVAGIRYYVNTCSDEALMANAEYLESALKNMTNANKSTVESALKELSARKAQIQAKPVEAPVEDTVEIKKPMSQKIKDYIKEWKRINDDETLTDAQRAVEQKKVELQLRKRGFKIEGDTAVPTDIKTFNRLGSRLYQIWNRFKARIAGTKTHSEAKILEAEIKASDLPKAEKQGLLSQLWAKFRGKNEQVKPSETPAENPARINNERVIIGGTQRSSNSGNATVRNLSTFKESVVEGTAERPAKIQYTDAEGKVVATKEITYDTAESNSYEAYIKDADGNNIGRESTTEYSRTIYETDPLDPFSERRIEYSTSYDRTIYEYDANGLRKSYEYEKVDNKEVFTGTKEQIVEDGVIREVSKNADGKVIQISDDGPNGNYIYRDENGVVTEVQYPPEKSGYSDFYSYNKEGKIWNINYNNTNKLQSLTHKPDGSVEVKTMDNSVQPAKVTIETITAEEYSARYGDRAFAPEVKPLKTTEPEPIVVQDEPVVIADEPVVESELFIEPKAPQGGRTVVVGKARNLRGLQPSELNATETAIEYDSCVLEFNNKKALAQLGTPQEGMEELANRITALEKHLTEDFVGWFKQNGVFRGSEKFDAINESGMLHQTPEELMQNSTWQLPQRFLNGNGEIVVTNTYGIKDARIHYVNGRPIGATVMQDGFEPIMLKFDGKKWIEIPKENGPEMTGEGGIEVRSQKAYYDAVAQQKKDNRHWYDPRTW